MPFSESRDIATPHRHVRTRLYMTSESHVHSMISVLRCGQLFNVSIYASVQSIFFQNVHVDEIQCVFQKQCLTGDLVFL